MLPISDGVRKRRQHDAVHVPALGKKRAAAKLAAKARRDREKRSGRNSDFQQGRKL
jgi:hypothetical protein